MRNLIAATVDAITHKLLMADLVALAHAFDRVTYRAGLQTTPECPF